jgi:hypothetical protein
MTTYAIIKIRIEGPESTDDKAGLTIDDYIESIDWSNVEGLINDSLPEGYYCKIEE